MCDMHLSFIPKPAVVCYICCAVCAAQIADTLVVKPGGAAAENLCNTATKLWDKVSYILNDDQEVRAAAPCCLLLSTTAASQSFVRVFCFPTVCCCSVEVCRRVP
jgi:hypothetical protein